MKQTFIASASELQSSPLFLQITTPMFVADEPNLNSVACTEAFIDDIIAHQDEYVGLPLVADVSNLISGNYSHLGHLYDRRADEFKTTSIGCFQAFEKAELKSGKKALIGYARVWKRNKAVCKALSELFTEDMLKFSFEISTAPISPNENGVMVIDASADNCLEGMCVVSFPACPEAVAEQLVAEIMIPKDGDPTMEKENKAVVAEAETKAEEATASAAEATAETTASAETEATASAAKATAETAAEPEVTASTEAAECEDDEDEDDEEENEDKLADEKAGACNDEKQQASEESRDADPEPVNADIKLYAELSSKLDGMMNALAELIKIVKEEDKVVDQAVAQIESSTIGEAENKMLAEVEVGGKEYSLLKEKDRVKTYSLL